MSGLTCPCGGACSYHMQRILQWIALSAAVLSVTSCGLPGALARTAGNATNSLGGLMGPLTAAAAAGAL